LTAAGATLFSAARHFARANEEAQAVVRQLRRQSAGTVKLGAPLYTANVKQRIQLVGRFVCEHPEYALEIVNGWNADLIEKLRRSEIDLAFIQGDFDMAGLDRMLVCRSYAHFLVPQEHELAAHESMSLEDLAGHAVVSLPAAVDPPLHEAIFSRLAQHRAVLIVAPEPQSDTMEQFARLRRMILLRFSRSPGLRKPLGDMVRIPLRDPASLVSDIHLLRRSEPGSAAMARLWEVARSLAPRDQEAVACAAPPPSGQDRVAQDSSDR
jgi:DNA-binding transcriptional LysR family regulator